MKTFNTHDGLKIRFDTYTCGTKTCRGVVVLLGGRSEFIEKYRETVDQLLARERHRQDRQRGQGSPRTLWGIAHLSEPRDRTPEWHSRRGDGSI